MQNRTPLNLNCWTWTSVSPQSSHSRPTAVRWDRPADRRPGGDGGALHPAAGRGAEGGAAGGAHRGRLGPGEQDGEGLAGHPQGHRLHSLPLHPLRVRAGGRDEAERLSLRDAVCAYKKMLWCLHGNSWLKKREWFLKKSQDGGWMSIVIYCTVIKPVFQKHVISSFSLRWKITHSHTHPPTHTQMHLVSQINYLPQQVSLIHLMTSLLQVAVQQDQEGVAVTLGTRAAVKTWMTLAPSGYH